MTPHRANVLAAVTLIIVLALSALLLALAPGDCEQQARDRGIQNFVAYCGTGVDR